MAQVENDPEKAASDTPQVKRVGGTPQDCGRDWGGKASRRHTAEFDTRVNPRERFQTWISDTEERFREFIEILKECLIFVDEDLRFSHTNAQFPKLLGYELGEVVGHYVVEYLDPENRTLFLRQTERQRQGKGRPYELSWVRKDGEKIPTLIAPRVITDLKGSIRGFFSVVTDITELKEAVTAAKENEAHFQSLMKSAIGFSVYRLAVDKADAQRVRVEFVSPSISDMKALEDPYRFETWEACVHPDDLDRIRTARRKAFETHRFDETFRLFNAKRGEWRWTQSMATGVPSDDGKMLYLNGISIDVTEQKEAEASLRESKRTTDALLNATADSAVLLEPDGAIIALNHPMADLLGQRTEDLIGTNWYDFIPPEMIPIARKRSEDAFVSGRSSNFVSSCRGEWYDTRRYPVIDETGKAYRLAVYIRNITEKKRGEQILEQREKELKRREEKLQQMNAALQVLLEVRTRDKEELEEREFANVRKLILPKIERIKRSVKDEAVRRDLESLERKLQDIVSPFASKLTSRFVGLTPTEIRIADLVREGKSSKEIAGMFHLSVKTISAHRENIRKKLAIKKTKTNLRTHLLTLFTYNA